VKFQVNFSAADAGDIDTHGLDYLSLDRISPVLDAAQIKHAASQVCVRSIKFTGYTLVKHLLHIYIAILTAVLCTRLSSRVFNEFRLPFVNPY